MKVLSILLFISITFIRAASAQETDCLTCHKELSEGRYIHNAISSGGCQVCHSGIISKEIPHKSETKFPKGLGAETVELCYTCHDKTRFYGSTVHAPVGIGLCTSCHNPHHSEIANLLIVEKQTLCFNCHEKEKLTGQKNIHAPVNAGECLQCHAHHASNNEHLILKKGNILCRKCHRNVEKEPHAVTGFKYKGHPIRGKEDPIRKGKTFECLSCHMPHTSEWIRLLRYKADSLFDLCLYCHPQM